MSKPILPPRDRGIQNTSAPRLPVRPPSLPARTPVQPTDPLRPVSAKPIIPPRVPLNGNGPALPARTKTVTTIANDKVCGRQKPAKYELRDFTTVDSYVKSLPEYGTPRELSHALTCNFDDIVDKYRAIFAWVGFNIAYDWDSYSNNRVPPQTGDSTFKNKKAVCAGYSMLFQQLCDASQLHCIELNGYAKGFGFSPDKPLVKGSNHAWNAIFVHDEWRMIDSTWGAGALTGNSFQFKFNPFFFLTDPEEFIYQHMPMDDSKQFTASRFTWDQFFAMNNLSGGIFRSGIQMLNHNDCGSVMRPTQGQEIEMQFLVPETLDVLFGFDINGKKAPCNHQSEKSSSPGMNKVVATFRVNNVGPSKAIVFCKQKSDEGHSFNSVLTMHVLITPHPSGTLVPLPDFPTVHTQGTSYTVLSPLVAPLQARVTYTFIIKDSAPDAQRTTRTLLLWLSKPGASLQKKVKDGQVTYEAVHHVTAPGELKIMEKRGNMFSPIGIWQV